MPRPYPPETKAGALDRLQANGGDIMLTSVQTGISQRTLYDWRRRLWLQQTLQQHPPLPQQQNENADSPVGAGLCPRPEPETPDADDDLEALSLMRRRILQEL